MLLCIWTWSWNLVHTWQISLKLCYLEIYWKFVHIIDLENGCMVSANLLSRGAISFQLRESNLMIATVTSTYWFKNNWFAYVDTTRVVVRINQFVILVNLLLWFKFWVGHKQMGLLKLDSHSNLQRFFNAKRVFQSWAERWAVAFPFRLNTTAQW